MVLEFKSKKDYLDLLEVLESQRDSDFYLTKNNERINIDNLENLKELLKESHHVYYENEASNKGIILIWKSFGGDITRNYIKLTTSNVSTARRLITILLWNYNEKLFIKIRKDSPYIFLFKEKGFKFIGGRGSQILLEKTKSFGEKLNVSFDNKE